MSQIDAAGLADLRTYIQNNWPFVAVVDSTGAEVLRWDVAANADASWTSGPSSNPLTAELTIEGNDIQNAGGSLPVTLVKTEAYKTDAASTVMSDDPITDATFEAPEDSLVITHEFQIPPL